MLVELLKCKILRAVITGCHLEYEGSLSVPRDLMNAAGLLPCEKILVVNCNNGSRLWTYAIETEPGTGEILLNGAAARMGEPGDIVIILAFAQLDPAEAAGWKPTIVKVDGRNRVIS